MDAPARCPQFVSPSSTPTQRVIVHALGPRGWRRLLLESLGYEVVLASGGDEAFALTGELAEGGCQESTPEPESGLGGICEKWCNP